MDATYQDTAVGTVPLNLKGILCTWVFAHVCTAINMCTHMKGTVNYRLCHLHPYKKSINSEHVCEKDLQPVSADSDSWVTDASFSRTVPPHTPPPPTSHSPCRQREMTTTNLSVWKMLKWGTSKEPVFNLLKNINSPMIQRSYIKCWGYQAYHLSKLMHWCGNTAKHMKVSCRHAGLLQMLYRSGYEL